MGRNELVRWTFAVLALFASSTSLAQVSATFQDVAYDTQHVAQKLDVYLTKSDRPTPAMIYIHGGGWRAGSKRSVRSWLLDGVESGQFSVVSVEYRFTDVAPHPAQVNDCLRAIQFVRHKAVEWNINERRIGVTGGSAGGHLSLWVALHDDARNASSSDPIVRQSSRVACAVSFAGPTDWTLLKQIEHRHPAYRQLLGYEPGRSADTMDKELMRDVSPINFVSRDDPAILQVHGDKDVIVPVEHALRMDRRLRSHQVHSELVIIEGANHGLSAAAPPFAKRARQFVRKQLLGATMLVSDGKYEQQRRQMVEDQLRRRDIRDPTVLEAMRKVPRHEFVPEDLRPRSYADGPLPIGHGQTISQPYIVALMTQLGRPQAGSRVLDVGTGSGYQAAVLAEIVDKVYGIEIVERLADEARERLLRLGITNVEIRHGDGYRGWPEQAPFDLIVVAAAPDHIPQPLIDQLAPGGRLVIPVGDSRQHLTVVEKRADGSTATKTIAPVAFVPMTGQAQQSSVSGRP